MRPARVILLSVLLLAASVAPAGCDFGSESEPERAGGEPTAPPAERTEPSPRQGVRSPEGMLIRAWLQALQRNNYNQAALFFAPGALIDQGVPFRLRSDRAARRFNARLPCRADLVRLKDEGEKVLASFRLRAGPGGQCTGVVRVRFSFRGKRFSEFVQLPSEAERPEQERRSGEPI
ncbi:MAG TPA: hypothetical protein VHJ37_14640 [Thermoleophilaceae bacterium]|nr:hypothetical protein [Thermoleophilaceae bacterium]